MKEKISKYLRLISTKKKRNITENCLFSLYSLYKKAINVFGKQDNKILSKAYLYTKSIERSIISKKINFIAVDDLVLWTTFWIRTFPNNYDIIIGIPRSGLLVANLIALKLGKPLTTPELFEQDFYWKSRAIKGRKKIRNVLLIDDSIVSGDTMLKYKKFLNSRKNNFNITTGALIATENTKKLVDLYYKIISTPRIFEWNLLHGKKGKLATDFDGVICENCPSGIDLNETLYKEWVRNAKPYLIPDFEIDVILSNRLEFYRNETEEWLNRYNVKYKKLILWNISSKGERNGKQVQHKVNELLKIKPDIFWESSLYEAKLIWKATNIPTICIDEMILFGK